MVRGALQRLAVLFAVVVGLTALVSLALGALTHSSLLRALADGFYIAGTAVLIGSFILGMRGPLRAEWGEGGQGSEGGGTGGATGGDTGQLPGPRGGVLPRAIRKTTLVERSEARKNSLALFTLGIALVAIGAGFDPSRHFF